MLDYLDYIELERTLFQALVYCFGISAEGYEFGHTKADQKNQKFVER